jgi:threonyl-tRNA synthetase
MFLKARLRSTLRNRLARGWRMRRWPRKSMAISSTLTRPLEKDTDLRLLTEKDPEALEVYRHSSAHLLAAAVLELFPETKLGHGPATESGFFYDFYRPTPFTPEDLEKIEKKMQELVQQNIPYAREFLPRDQGLEEFKKEGDFMKCHFIEQFTKPDEKISIYRTGKFTDFCRGPHIPSTGKIKAFKLFNIAGAYWLGDEKNPQLQRIYGTSFFSKKISTRTCSKSKKRRSATIACWGNNSICSRFRSWRGRG